MESSWKSHSLWCVNVNVPRVICLPTDMKTCGGNEVLHTGPHTPGCGSRCFDAASLLVSRWKSSPSSQMLTVNILPLYHTRRRRTFPPPPFLSFLHVFLQNSGRVFFFPASPHKHWEMYSKPLETDDNWLLGCICDATCLCLGSGSWSVTPDVVWWRRMRKRNVMNGCRHLSFLYMTTNNQIKVT